MASASVLLSVAWAEFLARSRPRTSVSDVVSDLQ